LVAEKVLVRLGKLISPNLPWFNLHQKKLPKWPKPESLDDKLPTISALHAIGLNDANPIKKTHQTN
jgi:hypothetical protein